MARKRYLIVIAGPTAIGKTSTAIQLANYFGLEILSADSRQFYREMTIGTAKPSVEELAQAPHHFINTLSINDAYSVGDYERAALQTLATLHEGYEAAILVGGSGLYIQAVCEGLDDFPVVPKPIQQKWNQLLDSEGISFLQAALEEKDPLYFKHVDIRNPHRLIRALSVIEVSGQPFSKFWNQQSKERPFEIIYLLLEMDRSLLYERINKRVDAMIEAGLVEEALRLFPLRQLRALQTVGYEELFQYFEGKISIDEAINLIKRNSRRYAKRQMTWFRKKKDWQIFSPVDVKGMQQHLLECFT